MYHGHGKRSNFFEGWYFKFVDVAEQHVHAVIPGVFLGQDRSVSHAFVQVLDGLSVPAEGLNSDLHGSAEYRAHLIAVLARRAVEAANGKA